MKKQSKLQANSIHVQFQLANIWQSRGKFDRAITGLKEIIRLQPDYIPAHLELGNLLHWLGQDEEAIAVFRRAIALNPTEPSFRKSLDDILAARTRSAEVALNSRQATPPDRPSSRPGQSHILLYTDCSGIHGAEQCNHVLMLDLAAAGYRITCAQSKASHYLIDERHQAGIQHWWLADDNTYDATKTARTLIDQAEAEQILTMARPDLIIFSDGCPLSNLAAKQVAVRLGIPYLVVVHCVTPEWTQKFAPYLTHLPNLYKQARRVIAVSQENLNLLHQFFGLPKNLGQVILNGRPAQYFTAPDESVRRRLRQELDIPPEAVVVFTSGRLEIVKGYQYQAKAIMQLQKRAVWPQLYFVWAGTGSLESKLKAIIAQIGAAAQVKFLGERPDIPDLLDAADIFVLPSQFEGMPLSLIEAMAKGLPVLATAVSGAPEALGETGKLLPNPMIDQQATINELATTLESWANSPTLRLNIGQACQRRAETLFRADRMLENYTALINQILEPDQLSTL